MLDLQIASNHFKTSSLFCTVQNCSVRHVQCGVLNKADSNYKTSLYNKVLVEIHPSGA